MANNELIELIKEYEEIRNRKDRLAEETKQNNKAYKEIQEKIVEVMAEEDIPMQGLGSYNYYPQTVTHYSFLSEEKIAMALPLGKDKFDVMRENGFGFLIKETINQRSMDTAFREYLAENDDELPEDIEEIVSTYDEFKVSRRKATGDGLKKAKAAIN